MKSLHIAFVMIVVGCVEQGAGPPPKKIDPTYVQSHLLSAPPADPTITQLNVRVGDTAVYLGNKVDRPRVAPGQPITITHYWKIVKSPGPAWNIFTLVRGPANTADFMNLLPTDMQIAHGPALWEPGEIIEDVQTFTVRPDWKSKEATVFVGLIEQGKHGTLDRMAATGPNTQERMIVARVLEIDLSRAPAPKGTAYVPRAQGAITIDGVATDAGWAGAVTSELTTAEGGADPLGKAVAKMVWDDQYLYVHVAITDSDIVSPYKQQDDPLWKGDCIELFIDADGNRRGYVELQANPLGVTFDSWFAETRAKPGDEAWDSAMVAGAKLRGGVEPGDSGDTGWDVELGIPWAAVKGKDDAMAVKLPPKVGDRWRLNVVRVDRKSPAKPGELPMHGVSSWNRITMADFHALDRMLTVVFADATGSIVPQAQGPDPVPAATIDITLLTQVDPKQPSLVIDVVAAGARIGNKIVEGAELANQLAAAMMKDRTTQLVLRIEPGISHVRGRDLIDRAKAAGFTRFAFAIPAVDLATTNAGSGSAAPATGPLPDPAKPIELEIAAAGVRVGGQQFTDDQLANVMRAILARDAGARIVVRIEGNVPHARVVAVLGQVSRIGFKSFALAAAVPATLSGAASAALAATKGSIEIEVTINATRFANEPLTADQLDALLRAAFARDKTTQVIIRADAMIPHQRAADVFERAKQIGFTKLAIGTRSTAASLGSASPAEAPLEVNLPTGTVMIDPQAASLVVEIPAAGDVIVAGKAVSDDELSKLFAAAFTRSKTTQVIFKADKGTAHSRVVKLLERAKQAGLTRLAIATR